MLASGDWVTIRYDGLKYFEKPPFQLWMTALAFGFFGVGEWQARLWVACSGAAALLMTALATHRWFGRRAALYAALVLLAAPGWNLASHFNSLDMGVSAALTFVLAGVLIAQHPSNTASARRLWMWASWTAMAVAVLTKGLIGIVLPGMVLVVYSLLSRDFAIWRRIHLVSGALLMLFGIGLTGEYVGRIQQEVRRRPRYRISAVLEDGEPSVLEGPDPSVLEHRDPAVLKANAWSCSARSDR